MKIIMNLTQDFQDLDQDFIKTQEIYKEILTYNLFDFLDWIYFYQSDKVAELKKIIKELDEIYNEEIYL